MSLNHSPLASATVSAAGRATPPIIRDGLIVVDALLKELSPHDVDLLNAVLDLRSVCAAGDDAEECVQQLFRVRDKLAGRHYYAFFRVRSWARRSLRVEIRPYRCGTWRSCDFPLNGGRIEEAINVAIATVLPSYANASFACVRFAFARTEPCAVVPNKTLLSRWAFKPQG